MRRPPAALVVALITFLNASIWAVVTPAFQGPDEESHAAYAVQLAETGKRPDRNSPRQFISSEGLLALRSVDHWSVTQLPYAQPPWLGSQQRAYERLEARHPKRDDGGGRTGAAQYGPVYYLLPAAGYKLAGGSFFDRLFAMRLMSALLAGVVAACAFGIVRELLPRERWAAVAAGLLVGFQPMFGFISGGVTADAGVDAAGAALLFLLIRAMRRGLSPALAAAIPATFVLGVMAKTAMAAFAPAVLLALVILARRRRVPGSSWWVLGGAAVLILAIGMVVWRDLIPLSGTAANVAPGEDPAGAGRTIGGTLSYLWQVYLPPLPFMKHIYTGSGFLPIWPLFKRSWGAFGWQSVDLPPFAFYVIALVTAACVVLAVRAAIRERAGIRNRAGELLVLAVAAVSVVISVHVVFARYTPGATLEEQGRYFFPVISVGAVAAVGACYGLGRRLAPLAGTALVTGMMLFSVLSQLFVLTSYYS